MRHMIKKDPSHRLSAEEYMIQQRGKAFPEYFYTFLKIYLQQFVSTPFIPPDDRITRSDCTSSTATETLQCHTESTTTQAQKLYNVIQRALLLKHRNFTMSHREHCYSSTETLQCHIRQIGMMHVCLLSITQSRLLQEKNHPCTSLTCIYNIV